MKKKIIIRSLNWIGDFIMMTPALSLIRKSFPDHQIDILVRDWALDLLSGSTDIDNIIVYNTKKLSKVERLNFLIELRHQNYDIGIIFPKSFTSALDMKIINPKKSIGYSYEGRNLLLSKPIKYTDRIFNLHESFQHQYLVEKLINSNKFHNEDLKLEVNENDYKLVEKDFYDFCKKNKLDEKKAIGINFGAFYGPAKKWDKEKYCSLANKLIKEHNCPIILFGGNVDLEDSQYFVDNIDSKYLINIVGKTNLMQSACYMKLCKLFITNDSGPMHMASAVNTKVCAIFGSTNRKKTIPFKKDFFMITLALDCSPCMKRVCPLEHTNCLKDISVDMVYSEINGFVSN